MDLPGPKLRTGPVESGPWVMKIRPRRDVYGRVTAPARVWLTPAENAEAPPSAADALLEMPARWLAGLGTGSCVTFDDARAASRSMTIVGMQGEGRWAESAQTNYIVPGTELRARPVSTSPPNASPPDAAAVAEVPPRLQTLTLKRGDVLILTRSLTPGRPAVRNARGQATTPAMIGVTLPEIFGNVRAGEPVWFDDGRIGGAIRSANPEEIQVEITQARSDGKKAGCRQGCESS